MRYVIIGGSIASVGAIEGIRKADREGTVTVISDEPNPYYSRPLISYYLAGKIKKEALYYRNSDFYKKHGVEVLRGKAGGITPRRTVTLEEGGEIPFDRLLLATGGTPLLYNRLAEGRDNVVGFYTLQDAEKIRSLVSPHAKAVIIGAGLVGLKAAEALYHLGVAATVVDFAPGLLAGNLDLEAGRLVQRRLEDEGLEFRLGAEVKTLEGAPRVERVVLNDGSRLSCDLVIIAAGTRPNLAIAADAGLAAGQGILVDSHMRTSLPGVYAAGDVAEARELLSGDPKVAPLLPLAWEQGRTAGLNMAGQEVDYRGSLAVNSTSLLGLAIMSAGDSRAAGIKAIWNDPPGYRKIVMENGVITGLIAVSRVDNMGLLAGLIRRRVSIKGQEARLLEPRLNGLDFKELLEAR